MHNTSGLTSSLTWAFEQNDDKITLRLTGALSRKTLLPLWEQRYSFLSADKIARQQVIWELADLTRIDSAGFALLCDFLHHCQTQAQMQIIQNAPEQFLTLADLLGLSKWIDPFLQQNGKN
ncbi:lipid asymmetry maintenance protein MlaB [Avibacterium sp. 20-126]|uniref:STAS domain-containing protein n=1 Tax=Avibacterium sp. 20-126 TaxID=2911524 RepID=UPI0021873BD0|nr:lipid asymmetry maintenance protein MlaB [Avibacterium sp. 20-126]